MFHDYYDLLKLCLWCINSIRSTGERSVVLGPVRIYNLPSRLTGFPSYLSHFTIATEWPFVFIISVVIFWLAIIGPNAFCIIYVRCRSYLSLLSNSSLSMPTIFLILSFSSTPITKVPPSVFRKAAIVFKTIFWKYLCICLIDVNFSLSIS